MLEFQDSIIKIIKLFKPEFYNKITWTVVITGLALIGTPLWEEIISAIINKEYNLKITSGGNEVWGYLLVALGLLYNLLSKTISQYIEYKQSHNIENKKVAHDLKIFNESLEILTEQQLENYFYKLLNDHSYNINEDISLTKYSSYLSSQENQFINKKIKNTALDLVISLNKLLHFTALNFWKFPITQNSENTRYCMHPEKNIDRGGYGDKKDDEFYMTASTELTTLSNKTKELYDAYRNIIKHEIYI